MRSMKKSILMTSLICSSVLWGGTRVFAAETLEEFTLDPLVVTATRMESRDLDTPAAIEVIDRVAIEQSGAGSAYDAIKNSLGIFASNQGPNGIAMGSMTSRINIRGVDKGTLVLVDGMPLNQDGKYNLEDFPADAIEKIEIVRGGGSVLYGSEATGGVINIITKNYVKNSIKISAGNYGKERYSVNLGADKFNMTAHLENRGKFSNMTTTKNNTAMGKTTQRHYDYLKGEDKGILWNYNITDNLKFTHSYVESRNAMAIEDNTYKSHQQKNEYEDHNNIFILQYDDKKGLKSHFSYNTQERSYDQTTYKNTGVISEAIKYSWRKGHNYNFDIQKEFDVNKKDKILVGADFKREDLDVYNSATKKMGSRPAKPAGQGAYERNIYSIYASYDWGISEKDNLIFNARETFVRNCKGDNKDLSAGTTKHSEQVNQSKFTPEIQYIRKLTQDSSLYAKAGKSFRLPELTKLFGGSVILPTFDLKPEQGKHYEIGYKLNENNRSWRLALFKYNIDDSIEIESGSAATGDVKYNNTDVKNTGVELSLGIKHNDNFDTMWGVTYGNPKSRSFSSSDDGKWIKYDNKLQFTAGANYHDEKFSAALMANYIGVRANKTDNGATKVKPALFTDLDLSYAPEKNQKIFLHVNNLLDRQDYTTSAAPDENTYAYNTLGINFILGYEFTF